MKAQYIIDALEAMRHAEITLMDLNSTPESRVRAYGELVDARCALKVWSGIDDMQVEVQKAEA